MDVSFGAMDEEEESDEGHKKFVEDARRAGRAAINGRQAQNTQAVRVATCAAHKFYCVARPLDGSTGGMAVAESAKAFVDNEVGSLGLLKGAAAIVSHVETSGNRQEGTYRYNGRACVGAVEFMRWDANENDHMERFDGLFGGGSGYIVLKGEMGMMASKEGSFLLMNKGFNISHLVWKFEEWRALVEEDNEVEQSVFQGLNFEMGYFPDATEFGAGSQGENIFLGKSMLYFDTPVGRMRQVVRAVTSACGLANGEWVLEEAKTSSDTLYVRLTEGGQKLGLVGQAASVRRQWRVKESKILSSHLITKVKSVYVFGKGLDFDSYKDGGKGLLIMQQAMGGAFVECWPVGAGADFRDAKVVKVMVKVTRTWEREVDIALGLLNEQSGNPKVGGRAFKVGDRTFMVNFSLDKEDARLRSGVGSREALAWRMRLAWATCFGVLGR